MFKTVTPEQAGISSSEVSRFINYLNDNSLRIHSLLLIRDDKMFTEAYWKPFNKDFCHRQYSQTKSFVGVAIGLLISDGLLSLDDKISKFFGDKIDDVDSASHYLLNQTIEQMLTMSTVGEGKIWLREKAYDRTHLYFNNRPYVKMPGALWEYDSPGSQILSCLVEKVTGMAIFEFLNSRIFSHLGTFKNAKMLKTPNGDTWGDSAMICTPRDMASFAKLIMDNGNYQGKSLINEDYVKTATSKVVDNSEVKLGSVFGNGYGYQIWRAPRDGYAFVGMGGQITVTIPSKRLIFVINSDTQGNASAYDIIVNGFISFIVDRIADTPLLPDANAYLKLAEQIKHLELFALKGIDNNELKDMLNGQTYICDANNLGITKFKFTFNENGGEFAYTNEQGDKVIPFGVNKNAFGKFPQLGYSKEFGGVPTSDGHTYNDAVSLRFTKKNKIQMLVQIIDEYFGTILATFAFVDNEVACKFVPAAEYFLREYDGYFIARAQNE